MKPKRTIKQRQALRLKADYFMDGYAAGYSAGLAETASEVHMTLGLKRCPFCGEEGRVMRRSVSSNWWWAMCMNEQCLIGPHTKFATESDAIVAWNTRA